MNEYEELLLVKERIVQSLMYLAPTRTEQAAITKMLQEMDRDGVPLREQCKQLVGVLHDVFYYGNWPPAS